MSSTGTEVSKDGIKITRTLDAPRRLVFDAWTEPAQFAQWFGEKNSTIPLETASMDVRPGGAWNVVMVVDTGSETLELPFGGEYREVAPPERLVFTMTDPEDPTGPKFETVTVVLTEIGAGRTQMVVTQRGGNLPEDEYGRAAEGYGVFFDRLAEHLARR